MISFVVPSFNRAQGMIELIEAIYKQTHAYFEIIVVDDCSPDDTNELIKMNFPEVILLENEINSGPAISRDTGIRAARGEIIIGIDSDVLIEDIELCSKVIAFFNGEQSVSMLAFKLLTPEGIDDAQRWWHAKALSSHANKSFETDYFSGTGYAIKKDDYLRSGGFSNLLYMHYEELLLSYRLIDSGSRIVYEPSLVVIHNALPTIRRNKMKMFYKPRNQLIVAASCMPVSKAIIYLIPRLGKNLINAIKSGEIKEYTDAFGDFIKKRKIIFTQREVLKPSTFLKLKLLRK